MRQEYVTLRLILQKAVKLGQYRWEAFERLEWTGQGKTINRRPHFSDDEFRKLTDAMRSNDWLKHNHPRIAYDRALLRDYVLVMKNTGMRVGEARNLRWRDVQERKAKNGETYLVCVVDGKRGKRTVVCNNDTDAYFDRVKELTGKTKPDDHIWLSYAGEQKKDFSVGFKSLIKFVFGKDDDRTLYCLRHTYATKKIVDENISTKRLAELMGTSELMIDKHYGHYQASDYGDELAERRAKHKERKAQPAT
jgi:integrase